MFASNTKAGESLKDIRIVTEHLPPYQIAVNNHLEGGTVGLKVKQLLSNVLPDTAIEILPWARTYQIALHTPNTVIFSLVRTPERENKFIWIGKVVHVPMELVSLKTSQLQPVKNLSELSGIKIGVKRLDAVTIWLASQGLEFGKELIEVSNTITTMKLLEKGRIEVIPSTSQVIEFYCQTAGCNSSDFKTIYTFQGFSEELYLAMSLGSDEKLVEELQTEFLKLDFSGK